MIPDMTGMARGKIIPARKFSEEAGMRLPESIFLQTVSGDYPSDESMIHPAEPDIYARPDADTIRLVPWYDDPTASVIHDCFYADGSPVGMAPRYVLRRVMALYEAQGLRAVVAPELEFYLVRPNTDSDYPLEPPIGRSGRAEHGRQSFSIDAINEFEPLFEDIDDYCDVQGLEIDTLVHESGAAQMEVNLIHGDPMSVADQAFLFKRTVREAAYRHKIYATFMSKPMENEPGSAMHIHQSVVRTDTGHNVFSNPDGSASEAFYHFIGGLQRYVPEALSLLVPNVNAYRRLTRYHSAPINVEWGYDNRTAAFRVPNSHADSRRVENRIAGADANPYLAVAATLLAGWLGMQERSKPTDPITGSAYALPRTLSQDLRGAIDLLRNNGKLNEHLGEHFVRAYAAVKESEYQTFMHVISSWEREHLLLSV